MRAAGWGLTNIPKCALLHMRMGAKVDYDLVIHAVGDLQVRFEEQPIALADAGIRTLVEVLEWDGPLCKSPVFLSAVARSMATLS